MYAVVFVGNIVKFGKASNLSQRCSSHQRLLRDVVDIWYFEDRTHMSDREVFILSLANEALSLETGKEYFRFDSIEAVEDIFNKGCLEMFQESVDNTRVYRKPYICPIDMYDLSIYKIKNKTSGVTVKLNLTTRILLCYLQWVVTKMGCNRVMLNNRNIAKNLGVDRKTINREMNRLKELSIIHKQNRTVDGCMYDFHSHKDVETFEIFFDENTIRTGGDSDRIGGFGVFNTHPRTEVDELCGLCVV